MRVDLPEPCVGYQGPLYRALNPVWAREPLSGRGAALNGGRFNRKGLPALYTAMPVMGAVNEANQIGRPFEPVTLVSYDADLSPLFDATDAEALRAQHITMAELSADDWRLQMERHGQSVGQRIGSELAGQGYLGMIVPSFAKGNEAGTRNLVLWNWAGLRVIDTDGRLQR